MTWVVWLTSSALPAFKVMVSLRWTYCAAGLSYTPVQHPPSAAESAIATANWMTFIICLSRQSLVGRRLDPNDVAIRSHQLAAPTRDEFRMFFLVIHLAHEKKVDIIAGNTIIEWGRQALAGYRGLDELRRYDDDQVRFVLDVAVTAEQGTDDRHRAKPRYLRTAARIVGLRAAPQSRSSGHRAIRPS